MPFVSVTRLRVRSIRFLPSFAMNILRTRRQVRSASGFRGGLLLADRAWTFWTMTTWDNQASMRRYMTTGSHRAAMPLLQNWCDEASVVHWEEIDEKLPTWADADKQMRANGRASKVRHPSAQHAGLDYESPRTRTAGALRPSKQSE